MFEGTAQVNEPVNLVGMHNDLVRSGIESIIVDAGLQPWQDAVRNFGPDIVGITAPVKKLAPEIAPFVSELRDSGVKVIVGGVFATANPDFYASLYRPHAIVLGQGEPVMRDLIGRDFVFKKAKSGPFYLGNSGKTMLFRSDSLLDISEINYSRPYFLQAYDFTGWPNTMYGCFHRCIFCTSDGKSSFMPPERAISEISYLVRGLGAEIIFPMGGDFTGKPSQATEIVRGIISSDDLTGPGYNLNVRIDSLSKAISLDPGAWRAFFESSNVLFMPGVESFDPAKLVRLGKYRSLSSAKKHLERLTGILDFINGTKAMVSGNFIMHDPETSANEFFNDVTRIRKFIMKYPGHFTISDGEIFNHLMPVDGTRASEMYNAEGDEYYYPRQMEPFAILLTLYFYLARFPATHQFSACASVDRQRAITLEHLDLLTEGVGRIIRCVQDDVFDPRRAVEFVRELVGDQFPE